MTGELIQIPLEVSTMRRHLTPLLALLLATSACSGTAAEPKDHAKPAKPRPSNAVNAELASWMADLCTADKPMEAVSLSNMIAPVITKNTTEADRKPIQAFLRKTLNNVGRTRKGLAAMDQAPTAAGRKLLNSYRKDIDKLYSKLFEYTENAEWIGAETLHAPYTLARLELVTFHGMPFQEDAALTAAFRRAPECRWGSP